MKLFRSIHLFSACFLCGCLGLADGFPSEQAPNTTAPESAGETGNAKLTKQASARSESQKTPVPAQSVATESTLDFGGAARVVQYSERDVVRVKARLRFTTLIVLPKTEQILDFVCGDKEFWVVNGAQNFAYVKPAKAGGRTNLNLVTGAGNVYSFVLIEGDSEPDLKLFVEPRDESMVSALNGSPRFVSAQEVEDYRHQVEIAKAETRDARQAAHSTIDREVNGFKSEYPAQMKFVYRFQANQRPFLVSAIFHDGKFTYIQANPQEVPALYEVKDGKPNLVQFQFKNGTYIIDKILDDGYFAIGKQRLPFFRAQN